MTSLIFQDFLVFLLEAYWQTRLSPYMLSIKLIQNQNGGARSEVVIFGNRSIRVYFSTQGDNNWMDKWIHNIADITAIKRNGNLKLEIQKELCQSLKKTLYNLLNSKIKELQVASVRLLIYSLKNIFNHYQFRMCLHRKIFCLILKFWIWSTVALQMLNF